MNHAKRREDGRAYYRKNAERIIAHDREYRRRHPDMAAARAQRRRNNPREQARRVLHNALRRHEVVKPIACERCGVVASTRRLHGHHADYSRPLDVQWLCSKCHGEAHRIDLPSSVRALRATGWKP